MRLKATLHSTTLLLSLASSIEKLGKLLHMTFSPKEVQFYMFDSTIGCKMISTVAVDAFFEDYYIVSQKDNIITLTVSPDHLVRALKHVNNAEVSMKLIKKQKDAFLSFNLKTQNVSVLQDIPAAVIEDAPDDINVNASQFDVNIVFPSVLHVRNIAERFQKLSNHVKIRANQKGELHLGIRTDQAEVITEFTGLLNPPISYPDEVEKLPKETTTRDPDQFAEVVVEIKHFLKFLNCYHLSPQNTVCCIVDGTLLAFFVYFRLPNKNDSNSEDAQSVFFLPVISPM